MVEYKLSRILRVVYCGNLQTFLLCLFNWFQKYLEEKIAILGYTQAKNPSNRWDNPSHRQAKNIGTLLNFFYFLLLDMY